MKDAMLPKVNMNRYYRSDPARILLLGAGATLIALAGVYNEFLFAFLDRTPPLEVATVQKIRSVQLHFLLTGLVFFAVAESMKRISWLGSFMNRRLVTKMLLSLLVTFLLIFIPEVSLRPFAVFTDPKTTIYIRDAELGWKHRPNSEDVWRDIVVKINGKGLRGPELDYAKPDGVIRILYLGDSVTFGDGLESYEQTFPYVIESIFKSKFKTPIETINAGVSGYDAGQEYIYLSREGIKYSPDLVVVAFNLNDVTEKFGLLRFGGSGEGWQLSHTYSSNFQWLRDNSSIWYFVRKTGATVRFGRDTQAGAKRQETLDVKSLVDYPDRQDVMNAWQTTFEELRSTFDFCRERGIPVALVVFPWRFQFADVSGQAGPQKVVRQYAEGNGIPVLDLLPILAERMKQQGKKPEDYFLDSNHLSRFGNQIASEVIGSFIEKQGLLHHARQR